MRGSFFRADLSTRTEVERVAEKVGLSVLQKYHANELSFTKDGTSYNFDFDQSSGKQGVNSPTPSGALRV